MILPDLMAKLPSSVSKSQSSKLDTNENLAIQEKKSLIQKPLVVEGSKESIVPNKGHWLSYKVGRQHAIRFEDAQKIYERKNYNYLKLEEMKALKELQMPKFESSYETFFYSPEVNQLTKPYYNIKLDESLATRPSQDFSKNLLESKVEFVETTPSPKSVTKKNPKDLNGPRVKFKVLPLPDVILMPESTESAKQKVEVVSSKPSVKTVPKPNVPPRTKFFVIKD